jgi:arginine:ornithine antiporter/lysine permease
MMKEKKWGLLILTSLVVGNMVGSGIFMLPSTLAQTASPLGVALAWLLTGLGVLMIALVFGKLSIRRPDLTAGPQSYARELFESPRTGDIAGFSMVWGYWIANWISNVAIITSFAGYLSTFFPIMSDSTVLLTVGNQDIEVGRFVTSTICTILLWGTHFILITNLNAAGKLNVVATVTKIMGFTLFIVAALFTFQYSNLGDLYTPVVDSAGQTHGLSSQINMAMISTLWAFVGIESAVILSGRAKSQRDVSRATVIGLFIALLIYMGITLLIMGVLPQEVLRASDKPFVDALSVMIGDTGAIVMAILAIIALFGSTIGWILLSAEVPYQAAAKGVFPKYFAKVNKKGSPVRALTLTNAMSQLFILSVISGTISEAYTFLTTSATLAYLIPYLVSAIFFLKLIIKGQTYDHQNGLRMVDGIIAVFALIYSIYVIKSGIADMVTFTLGIGLFAAGVILYPIINRGKKNHQLTNKN